MTRPLSDFTRSSARRANTARQIARASHSDRGTSEAYNTSATNPRRMDDKVICPCFGCRYHDHSIPLPRRDFNRHWKECHA